MSCGVPSFDDDVLFIKLMLCFYERLAYTLYMASDALLVRRGLPLPVPVLLLLLDLLAFFFVFFLVDVEFGVFAPKLVSWNGSNASNSAPLLMRKPSSSIKVDGVSFLGRVLLSNAFHEFVNAFPLSASAAPKLARLAAFFFDLAGFGLGCFGFGAGAAVAAFFSLFSVFNFSMVAL